MAYRIDSPLQRAFMERIRERRAELELTQAQVAERLGISQPAYAEIETGRRTPSTELIEKVAAALKLTAILDFAPVKARA